jgi:hypothetical protein
MTLSDPTFVVVSTAPTAEGRYWAYVEAFDEAEAMELAERLLPAPSLAFRLPTQRIGTLVRRLTVYGPILFPAGIALLPLLAIQFRRSSAGFVVMSWAASFGYALLFEVTVLLLVVAYLATLDFACARVGSRTLRERSAVAPDGTVLEGPRVEDVIEAFGPERVGRTVCLVNYGFGAGLLVVVVLGVLSR